MPRDRRERGDPRRVAGSAAGAREAEAARRRNRRERYATRREARVPVGHERITTPSVPAADVRWSSARNEPAEPNYPPGRAGHAAGGRHPFGARRGKPRGVFGGSLCETVRSMMNGCRSMARVTGAMGRRPFIMASGVCVAVTARAPSRAAAGQGKGAAVRSAAFGA